MKELLFSKQKVLVDFGLLVLRLFMGTTFIIYAIKKVQGFDNYVALFSDKLDLPLPLINLYLVMAAEGIGGFLLLIGVLTRLVSLPLILTMVGAFFLVNLSNGFAASSFGIEVPLAYIAILLVLFSQGAGKYSVDNLFLTKK